MHRAGLQRMPSAHAFGRVIDARSVERIDQQRLASVRSTLDPLTLTPLRNAAMRSAWGRGKIDLPPGIAKKLRDTPVYVGREVRDPRFRTNLAKSMRVGRVSDQARNQKFKTDREDASDNRKVSQQADQLRRQEEQGHKQEMDRLNAEAARGNREAQRQARQLEQQQRKAVSDQAKAARVQERAARAQEQAQRKAAQQPQGERVSNLAKRPAQREVMRPQPVRAQPENPRPQVERQPVQPRQRVPQRQPAQSPQVNKPESKQQSQGPPIQSQGAQKQERNQEAQAKPGVTSNAGGGKAKGKGKP